MEMLFRPYRFRDHRSLWGRWQARRRRRERDTLEFSLEKRWSSRVGLPCPSENSHGGFVRAIRIRTCIRIAERNGITEPVDYRHRSHFARRSMCLGVPRVGVICARSRGYRYDLSLDKLFRGEEQRINTALHRTANDMIGIKTNGLNVGWCLPRWG
jgi:hypothetical protein